MDKEGQQKQERVKCGGLEVIISQRLPWLVFKIAVSWKEMSVNSRLSC